jgi:hypothetical protein
MCLHCRRHAARLLVLGLLTACASRPAVETYETRPVHYWEPPRVPEDPPDAMAEEGGNAQAPGPSDATDSGTVSACGNAAGQLFPPSAPWNRSVRTLAVARDSTRIIQYLETHHARRHRFEVEASIVVLQVDAKTRRVPFSATGDHSSPDCDLSPVPLPSGGSIEGESGYACQHDGDCHLIAYDSTSCRLYEMWRANVRADGFHGGCLAVWDTARKYPDRLRGDQCTSADAGGLPIAPLLFTADEVWAGRIAHAIRFILPNKNIRKMRYVRPATHATRTSGPEDAPPYGSRLRLRGDFDTSRLARGARVVAEALKEYGTVLADGGLVTFTAASDRQSVHKWNQVGFDARGLSSLAWTDFEVVDTGPVLEWNGDCKRTPISE